MAGARLVVAGTVRRGASDRSGVAVTNLASYIERIERLDEERRALGADRAAVFAEAKGSGFDPKAMRKIIQERRMDSAARAEQEAILDTYRHSLGMAASAVSNGDMSLRAAAKVYGVSKSAVHRAVPAEEKPASGTVDVAMAAYQHFAKGHGWPAGTLTPEGRAMLEARLTELGGPVGWNKTLIRAGEAEGLKGIDGATRDWFGLDWLLKADNLALLMDGVYDKRPDADDTPPIDARPLQG